MSLQQIITDAARAAELARTVNRSIATPEVKAEPMLVLLYILSRGTREVATSDIVREAYHGSNASYTLQKLQDAGLIGTRTDEKDSRRVWRFLTPAGRKVAQKVADRLDAR